MFCRVVACNRGKRFRSTKNYFIKPLLIMHCYKSCEGKLFKSRTDKLIRQIGVGKDDGDDVTVT